MQLKNLILIDTLAGLSSYAEDLLIPSWYVKLPVYVQDNQHDLFGCGMFYFLNFLNNENRDDNLMERSVTLRKKFLHVSSFVRSLQNERDFHATWCPSIWANQDKMLTVQVGDICFNWTKNTICSKPPRQWQTIWPSWKKKIADVALLKNNINYILEF